MDDFARVFYYFEKCSLTFFERKLISELYPVIKRTSENFTKKRGSFDVWPRYNAGYTDSTSALKFREKIDRIVKVLDSSDQKRESFLKYFPKWSKQRKQNIEKLREISMSMKNVRKVSNIVKITAGGVGIAGGMAILGSIILPPAAPALLPSWLGGAAASALLPSIFLPAAPAVSSLAIAGGVAAAGGAAGTAGASVTEIVMTQKGLKEVKEVIAVDRRLLERLGVFEFLDELNDAIDDLFGKSTATKILGDIVDFLNKIPSVSDKIQPILKALQTCLSYILPGISSFLAIGISLASAVLSIFFAVFMIRRRGCAILNHRFALGLASAVDASVEITRLIAAAGLSGSKLGELIPRQLAGKIAVGAIAGIGIALDIATITVSSIDLAKGSFSEEISMIREVANKLEKHLDSYQTVNDKLQKCLNKRLTITDVSDWTAVVANHVPQHAGQQDIKNAIDQYLPDEAWDCVIMEKLPTEGNHWLVQVPTYHSHLLLGQSHLIIKRQRCLVMQ